MVNSLSFLALGASYAPRDSPHYGRQTAIAHRKVAEKKIILVIFFLILCFELGKPEIKMSSFKSNKMRCKHLEATFEP